MSETNLRGITLSLPTDLQIVMIRTFDAPRELVWEMWTNPKHPPQWMTGPEGWSLPVCEIDLRVGGKWHFVWRKGDGEQMEMHGTYREITPPDRLINTENWGGDYAETLVTMTLTEQDGKTTMTCVTEYPSKDERDKALQTGMGEGAAESFEKMDQYLQTLK
jgi:uncharacterized protein YndB with AHSA1/START domain